MEGGAVETIVGVDVKAGSEEISDAGKITAEDCEVQDAGYKQHRLFDSSAFGLRDL
jgi:hypothetical protein